MTDEKANGGERIGVYVCQCGMNIAGTVDCDKVAEYAEGLDGDTPRLRAFRPRVQRSH